MTGTTRRAFQKAALATMAGIGLGVRPLSAQLRVDITSGRVEPMPIALSPLAAGQAGDAGLGTAIIDVVAADLEGSGLFRVIDRLAYIQSPEELQGVPRFADWRQINAQALVSGLVERTGANGIAVEFRLWDVFAGSQMRGLRYDGTEGDWRRMAHKIADVIYERLTGDGGYFDSRIVYISETGPATRRIKRLAMMDQDGANHSFLTDGSRLVLTPRMAPDGQRVAYLVYQSPAPRIVMRDLASGRESLLGSFQGMSFSPRFSPDGGRMLMTLARDGNSDIFSFSGSGREPQRLTAGPAIDTSPTFSPDGQRIVFNSDRGGSPQLYVMDADGGNVKRISYGAGHYGSPAWSPRGDLVAFTKIKGGRFHIGIMEPDGANERLLTRSFLDEGATWSPNGRVIMFSREDPGTDRTRLFSIDITGYNEREIATPLDASDPDWSPLIS